MGDVNIKEARGRLGKLIKAAEHGERVVITRYGRKVAEIVPVRDKGKKALPDLTKFRASVKTKGKALSQVVADMRRETRY